MPVMRVIKNKNYTTMSNVHLRDKNLSLKAKGLLSIVLTLPDDWGYSVNGLVSLCKENTTAVNSAIKELKDTGYLVVDRLNSNESGTKKFKYIYTFFENPKDSEGLKKAIEERKKGKPDGGNPYTENPYIENLCMENPCMEDTHLYKSTDILSTDKLNTKRLNTELLNTDKKASTKVEDNYKAFPSGKDAVQPSKLPYEYSKKQLDDYISNKVAEIINEVAPDETEQIGSTAKIIYMFYDKFLKNRKERHPILSDSAYAAVVVKLLHPISDIVDSDCILNEDMYSDMMDLFFDTDYGKYSGNRIDYRLSYFMQDTVQRHLMYRAFGM